MTGQINNGLRHCSFCAELIKEEAVLCKHCRTKVVVNSDAGQSKVTTDGLLQVTPDSVRIADSQISSRSQPSIVDGSGEPDVAQPKAPLAQRGQVDFQEESSPNGPLKNGPRPSVMAMVTLGVSVGMLLILGSLWISGKVGSDRKDLAKDSDSVAIKKSFRIGDYGDLAFQIDRIERTEANPASQDRAPDGVTYLVVYYSVKNEGKHPAEIDWTTKFILFTDEKYPTRFNSMTDLRGSGRELQPGFQRTNLLAIFRVPTEQLKKHLILDLYGSGADHRMAFQFVDNEQPPIAYSSFSSQHTAQDHEAKGETKTQENDIYTLSDDEIVFRTWQACDALQRNQLNPDEGIACDHLVKGSKVKVLERLGGEFASVRVQVISGSDLSDGSGSGWIPGKSLTQNISLTDGLVKRSDESNASEIVQGEKAAGQEQSVQATDGPSATTIDDKRTNLIDAMLAAESRGDNNVVEQARVSLEGNSKPAHGDVDAANKLNKLGLAQLKAKDYLQAVSIFEIASRTDPSDPKLLSNLGYAETVAGNLTAAEKDLRKSIALAPSRTVAWGDLGIVLAKSSRRDEAVAAFLIGNKFSKDDYTEFLRTLSTDEDSKVREAGGIALSSISDTGKAYP